ncbi:hypothetical protein [Alkalispirochaeta americana]|uniref:hypothetical protein n=1 Tax=Alkalispirochaeta americana TaxID=159291 RepID=UPI00117A18A8|nr:hypothetical protein [Alkalispirochaeta americana]
MFVTFLVLSVSGCTTGPEVERDPGPPRTGIYHLDVALERVQEEPLARVIPVYARVAVNLASLEADEDQLDRSVTIARRLDARISRANDLRGSELLEWAWMWISLASLDEAYGERAAAVSSDVVARARSFPSEEAGKLLFRLLKAQLANPNIDEESIRRTLDSLYLLDNDMVRARFLVEAAELIRDQGDRLALNPVVQQAIAIVPVIEDPTTALILKVRLADLSLTLGNSRDARSLQDQALRRAEQGLLVRSDDFEQIRQVLRYFLSQGDRPGAEAIIGNIAPVSSRAVAYAILGTVALQEDRRLPFRNYYDEACATALAIADAEVRARAVAAVIRLRTEGEPEWSPGATIAELLGQTSVSRFDQNVRIDVLSSLTAALIMANRSQEVARLRGLILSADELAHINLAATERLLAGNYREGARELLGKIERVPFPLPGEEQSPAYRIARLYLALDEYDRSIPVLADAERGEQSLALAMIPASHRLNPATVTDLERLARNNR